MGGYAVLVGELGWSGIVWSTAVVSSPANSIFKGIDQDSCEVFAVGGENAVLSEINAMRLSGNAVLFLYIVKETSLTRSQHLC